MDELFPSYLISHLLSTIFFNYFRVFSIRKKQLSTEHIRTKKCVQYLFCIKKRKNDLEKKKNKTKIKRVDERANNIGKEV